MYCNFKCLLSQTEDKVKGRYLFAYSGLKEETNLVAKKISFYNITFNNYQS